MAFADITGALRDRAGSVRGSLEANAPLAPITWFRVGGPAQALFIPEDADDLAVVLAATPPDIPVTVIGLGSNLLVRDGGIPGLVVRLGRGFAGLALEPDWRIRAGAAVRDKQLARFAAQAGVAGFAFFNGIPGSVGGALRMNAGDKRPPHEPPRDEQGRVRADTSERLIEARAVDRSGAVVTLTRDAMAYGYRHSGAPETLVFVEALFQGMAGDRDEEMRLMALVERTRQETQPTRARTGGSTFKNPPGHSAWELIDKAGCRCLRIGGAEVSPMHCNFLIADDGATAADIETLGETVRRRVMETSGVTLDWEIKRLGVPARD